jgi:hypothetical protein
MKKINFKYITIGLLLIIGSGCKKDFLNLVPVSNANVNSFYKTPADINNAVIAAYATNKGIFINNLAAQAQLDEVRSDNTSDDSRIDLFSSDSGVEWWFWSWDQCYRAIYTCNVVLEKAPGVKMDATVQNQYIAEAKYLRAIAYFELVQNYGGVPLVTSTPTDLSASAVDRPRNTVAEVYALIKSDLLFARAVQPMGFWVKYTLPPETRPVLKRF